MKKYKWNSRIYDTKEDAILALDKSQNFQKVEGYNPFFMKANFISNEEPLYEIVGKYENWDAVVQIFEIEGEVLFRLFTCMCKVMCCGTSDNVLHKFNLSNIVKKSNSALFKTSRNKKK